MFHRKILIIICAIVALIPGCIGINKEPSLTEEPKFKNQPFSETYDSIFQDRYLAPNISSFYSTPENVLGIIWFKKHKAGKDCSSANKDDFTTQRYLDYKEKKCSIEKLPPKALDFAIVKGGGSTNMALIVGQTAANAEYAFEVNTSEPGGAVFKSASECMNLGEIKKISVPNDTCQVLYTAGVVQTHFLYKTFTKFNGNLQAAYGAVTVGGETYVTTETGSNRYLLTVDPIDITHLFPSILKPSPKPTPRPTPKPTPAPDETKGLQGLLGYPIFGATGAYMKDSTKAPDNENRKLKDVVSSLEW